MFVNDTLPDLPQHPKTFSLHRATSAVPENRAFVRIVDVAVVPHNAFASVHDRFDTAYAEDDIVLGLELVVEVHYEEVYFAAAFASINYLKKSKIIVFPLRITRNNDTKYLTLLPATALVIAASAVIAELADKAMEHSVVEVVASAVVH